MPETELLEEGVGRASWRVWGTLVTLLVTRGEMLAAAVELLEEELAATDAACNRFSFDSELSRLNRAGGTPRVVGPVLLDDLTTAFAAAELTEGAVDPTVGGALLALGYDRDFDELSAHEDGPAPSSRPAPGWRSIGLDPATSTVTLPPGTVLDLGSAAKSRCADRAAERISAETATGTLVDLGGDLRVAGPPPPGGWQVAVVDDARHGNLNEAECAISVLAGALASSSTAVRTWRRGGHHLHHVIDPSTGWPADAVWRTVAVAAPTCTLANAISTASLVWGEGALFRVPQLGLAARFVRADGSVIEVGDWPRVGSSPALTGSVTS